MDEESRAALEWLRRFQGIAGDEALFRQPVATAERLAARVAEAARDLPFGAEPPDFLSLLEALAPEEGGR